MPNGIEDYIHRIGRTARAGAKGTAYAYITPDQGSELRLPFSETFPDSPLFPCTAEITRDLVKILKDAKQVVPPELEQLARFGGGSSGGRSSRGGYRGGGRGASGANSYGSGSNSYGGGYGGRY